MLILGVRGTAQQPRLFVGMILILIFSKSLGSLRYDRCSDSRNIINILCSQALLIFLSRQAIYMWFFD